MPRAIDLFPHNFTVNHDPTVKMNAVPSAYTGSDIISLILASCNTWTTTLQTLTGIDVGSMLPVGTCTSLATSLAGGVTGNTSTAVISTVLSLFQGLFTQTCSSWLGGITGATGLDLGAMLPAGTCLSLAGLGLPGLLGGTGSTEAVTAFVGAAVAIVSGLFQQAVTVWFDAFQSVTGIGLGGLLPAGLLDDLLGSFLPGLLGGTGGTATAASFVTAFEAIVTAVFGTGFAGILGQIPLLGPLLAALTGSGSGLTGGLGQIASFFTDLLGIFGNPTGLGTGNVQIPFLSQIPLFGDLLSLTDPSVINQITSGAWFTDLLSLLGNPLGLGGGSPTLGGLGSTPLLAPVQEIIDLINQAVTGTAGIGNPISTVLTNLLGLPPSNVQGTGGPATLPETFTHFWDQLWSGFNITPGTGKSIADVANSATVISQSASASAAALAVRDNKPAYVGIDATQETVFPLAQMTGATESTIPVTNSTAATGFIRSFETVNKSTIQWIGSGTTGITGMFLTVYQMDASGNLSRSYESGNIVGGVSNSLTWNTYDIPAGSQIAAQPGDVFGIEMSVTGSGTYNLVGTSMAWMPAHPTALPTKLGAVRNNANSGVAPSTVSSGALVYANNVPWFGFGLSGTGYHPPVTTEYTGAGGFDFPIPNWANVLDIIMVGSAAGGQGGTTLTPGTGGTAGSWVATTVNMGTDIPLSTTSIHLAIGNGGAGSPGGVIGGEPAGGNGSATVATATGWAGLTAAGGHGRTVPANDFTGLSPGSTVYNGQTYFGGSAQGVPGAAGIGPGGAGAGGPTYFYFGGPGGPGATGAVWIVARAVAKPPVILPLTNGFGGRGQLAAAQLRLKISSAGTLTGAGALRAAVTAVSSSTFPQNFPFGLS